MLPKSPPVGSPGLVRRIDSRQPIKGSPGAGLHRPGNKTLLIKITARHRPANQPHLITVIHSEQRKRKGV